jgi:hypothetical protein
MLQAGVELAKQIFGGVEAVKDATLEIAPGLKNIGPDIGAELNRLGTQGSMEFASGMWNGNAFVPYGPGQYTPDPEHRPEMEHDQSSQEMEHER